MKKTNLPLLFSAAVFFLACLAPASCSQNDDSDDDDDSDDSFCSKDGYYESNICPYVYRGFAANENCMTDFDYDWNFSSTTECEELVASYVNSSDACDQAAGECLNTIFKNGYADEEDCRLIAPLNCAEAWEEWNNCLALADSGDC